MSHVIQIKNLTKQFGKLTAVDNLTLDVEKGEIFGFLGPNGAGKSTTIRCMMGFNNPTSGNIKILGHDIMSTTPETLKDIGYLPGNVQLYDKWTGWDHIKFFEGSRGKSSVVDDLIKRLDYDPSVKFRHLSSGNKQKLGLILALMNNPKVLILDEPTVGLDPLLQNEIQKILLELNARGVTIFISSHNLSEIEKLCGRVAIIKNGKLIVVEEIDTLRERKIHHISAHFKSKISPKIFDIPGIELLASLNNSVQLSITGDINPVLGILAKHSVVDVEISHASLEDVFIKFYERKK